MFERAYRYRFANHIALSDAQDTLLLSILAAEGLFGSARVLMDAAYATDESIHVIVVDASTVVGQVVSAVFTAFITREFGPNSFNVRQVGGLARQVGGVSR